MNYKKSIAFILALTMCVPVASFTNADIISQSVVSATSNENVYYSYSRVYTIENEDTKDIIGISYSDGFYIIDISNVKSTSIQISLPNNTLNTNVGFNVQSDMGYVGYFGNNVDDNGVVTISIPTNQYYDYSTGEGVLTTGKLNTLLIESDNPDLTIVDGVYTQIIENKSTSLDAADFQIKDTPIDVTNYDKITLTLKNINDGSDETNLGAGCGLFLGYHDENSELVQLTDIVSTWINNIGDTDSISFDVSNLTDEVYIYNTYIDGAYTFNVEVTDIDLSDSNTYDIPQVDKLDLTTKQTDDTFNVGAIKSVTSNDEKVVSVGENNVVTAVAKGETTLTVEYIIGDIVEIPVNVSTLEINPSKTVNLEDTNVDLTKEVTSGTAIKWTSKDESIATIDETTGILTPVSDGNVTIIAEDKYGNQAEISIEITTDEVVQVEKTSVNLETTDTYQIVITNELNPKGYTTSDEKIATVDENGLITAVGEGTATINVISQDDVATAITVTVKNPTPVEISSAKSSIIIGEELALTVDNGVAKDWKSSDEKIATVDKNGNVTAISEGKVTITATDKVGNTSKVDIEVKKFSLNRELLNLAVEDTYKLSANDGNTIKSFTSANDKVATVTDKGEVTAVSAGSTTITVEDIFGNKIDVPVSVFDDTDYNDGKVSIEEDEDGNEVVKINKGDATEVKLELSSKANGTATGVLSYWDSETESNVEFTWVADFDSKGNAIVYVGDLPTDVEELVFRVDYIGYWDSAKNEWIDNNTTEIPVEVKSVSGNLEATNPDDDTDKVSTADILAIKQHILGIKKLSNTSKDYNKDGSINIIDLCIAKNQVLNK